MSISSNTIKILCAYLIITNFTLKNRIENKNLVKNFLRGS